MDLKLLINQISNAEKLAKKDVLHSVEQDLFDIKKNMVDDNHHKELLSTYMANLINNYHNLKNFYKASNDQFDFFQTKTNQKLNDIDRYQLFISFVSDIINSKQNDNEHLELKKEVIEQVKNIENIAYNTHLLKLKSETMKAVIRKRANKMEDKKPFNRYFKSIISPSNFMNTTSQKVEDNNGWQPFYKFYLNDLRNNWNNQIENNQSYDKETKSGVKRFIFNLITLSIKIALLHKKVIELKDSKYSNNELSGKEMNIELLLHDISQYFDHLNDYTSFLVNLKEEKKFRMVLEAQDFAIERIKRVLNRFKSEFYIDLRNSPLNNQFEKLILEIKNAVDLKKIMFLANSVKTKIYETDIDLLNGIWLSNPKISIDKLLKLGIEKGIWDENYNLITKRGSLYGMNKTLLGSLSIALKENSIKPNIDHNIIGKRFCEFFNIELKETTLNQYKAFSSGNSKIIKEFKKTFSI